MGIKFFIIQSKPKITAFLKQEKRVFFVGVKESEPKRKAKEEDFLPKPTYAKDFKKMTMEEKMELARNYYILKEKTGKQYWIQKGK